MKSNPHRIEIIKSEGSTSFQSYCPYTSAFVDAARMRGGQWSDSLKCWIFDVRDELAIRGLLVDIYGTDDYASCEKRTVRICLDDFNTSVHKLVLCGREIARRTEPWQTVWLGDGVVVLEGGFKDEPRRGGVCANEGTIIEIREFPRLAAEKLLKKHPDHVWLIGGLDRDQLRQEREQLIKRIAEIDALMEEPEEEDEIIADLQD